MVFMLLAAGELYNKAGKYSPKIQKRRKSDESILFMRLN
jgi:hypothetical protein